MAPTSTPALARLREAGVDHVVRPYASPPRPGREVRDHPNLGLEAAAGLGVSPERVFRTLIALVDGSPVVAVAPVAVSVDLKALASAFGGRRAALAEPALAERVSGSVVGGISPLAMRRLLPTVVDASVAHHGTILVSAGRRGLQVELAPADLIALTSARVAPIGRRT